MEYLVSAKSTANESASINIREACISFGTRNTTESTLPNPAELFLGSLVACLLKSVERFSIFLNFEYESANIQVSATREDRPPYLDNIHYELTIFTTDENLQVALLKKNLEKYGTIYNTVKKACSISGSVNLVTP